MIGKPAVVPERWALSLTAEQLAAIEYLSKEEVGYCQYEFRKERKCPHCYKPIDPDEPQDGHDADCMYFAVCDLAQMTDSE